MTAQDLDALIRADLVTRAGGTLTDAAQAVLYGPDEDGFWYLMPPSDDQGSWAWSQTPDAPESWTVAD